MSRLGPQAKKLFEVSTKKEPRSPRAERTKKYTFILPVETMKQVKHTAIERDQTISAWLTEAIVRGLKTPA